MDFCCLDKVKYLSFDAEKEIEDGKVKPIELTDSGVVIKSKRGEDLRIDITKLKTISYKSKSYMLGVSL